MFGDVFLKGDKAIKTVLFKFLSETTYLMITNFPC